MLLLNRYLLTKYDCSCINLLYENLYVKCSAAAYWLLATYLRAVAREIFVMKLSYIASCSNAVYIHVIPQCLCANGDGSLYGHYSE